MDRCAECGFDLDLGRAGDAGGAMVEGGSAPAAALGQAALSQGGARVATRREPDVWSPLEYACHLRDVLLVQRERVLAARRTEQPSFDPMGRDERVEHDGYATQRPHDVGRQLSDAAGLFAHVLSRLDASDWERTVTYNYPVRTSRSLRWVAVHTEHEVRHHLLDVTRQLGEGPAPVRG